MFHELLNYINCCKPKNELDKLIIKEENLGLSTNELTEKNKLLSEEIRQNIKKDGNYCSESIISFSNLKVKTMKKNQKIIDTLVLNAREIFLEGEIFFNKVIIIDKLGLKNDRRNEQNGITIFGISDDMNKPNSGIDFNLNLSKKKLKNKKDKNIPLFKIEYLKNEDIYTISVIKDVKMLLYIEHDFLIENNTSLEFMIGKVSIIINSPKDENDEKFHIEIEGKTYTYYKKKDLPITIGRVNTSIILKNTSISKVHSIIEYNEENNTLSIRDNNSTNGTYFVLGNRHPFIYILSDLTLKLLDSKFTIKIHEN
jgi:hypothetical protein